MRSSSNALNSTLSRWFIVCRPMQTRPVAPCVSPSPSRSALRLHQTHGQSRAGRFGAAAQGGKGRRHSAALQPGDGRPSRAEAPGELNLREPCCRAGAHQRLDERELVSRVAGQSVHAAPSSASVIGLAVDSRASKDARAGLCGQFDHLGPYPTTNAVIGGTRRCVRGVTRAASPMKAPSTVGDAA